MKKIISISLAVAMLFAILAIAVSAGEVTLDGTTYEVISPKSVEFSWNGIDETYEVKCVPQGGSTVEALIDGELCRDAAGFSTKGIVLFQNTWVPNEHAKTNAKVEQDLDSIPTFTLSMDLGAETSFDTAYLVLYHEIASCIAIPGNKQVIVETSKDGTTWAPVGDGTFYFNSSVADYNGAGDQGIDECAVPLGETVKSRYVRYTFTFLQVMEGGYWEWYTNVHDWCGLTELGVAKYKSGREQSKIDESDVMKDPTKVEGLWMCDNDDEVVIFEFVDNHGQKTLNVKWFDGAEFKADPLNAEVTAEENFKYSVLATHVTLTDSKGKAQDMEAELNGDGDLLIDWNKESYMLETFKWPEPTESTDPGEESGEQPGLLNGVLIGQTENEVVIFAFDDAAKTLNVKRFDKEAFAADGMDAEVKSEENFTYAIEGTHITLTDADGKTQEADAAFTAEGGIQIVWGDETFDVTIPDPVEESSEEPVEESSEEPSEEESAAESVEESKAESTAESSEEEGGLPTGAIVGIVVGAVALIGGGTAAGVIASKKKKK